MRISDKKPTEGVRADAPVRRAAAERRAAPAAAPVADSLAIRGIPEGELSPAVRAALQGLMEEVGRLRRDLEQAHMRIGHLERLADEDTLVPIPNRRAFVRELTRMISFAERYGSTGAVLYFDVDNMKQINDTLGHAAGDAALKLVAELLLQSVRGSDVVGRLGGDEFGVALAQTEPGAAHEKATALAAAIKGASLRWDGKPVPLSVAWGIYNFSGREQADSALAAADQAMYHRKRNETTPAGR